MASPTQIYMTRVRLKTRKAARRRKNLLNTHGTTPTQAAFFGDVTPPAGERSTSPRPAP